MKPDRFAPNVGTGPLLDASALLAHAVGERLGSLDSSPWTGAQTDPSTGATRVAALGPGLYDGCAGLAVFFATMAHAHDSSDFERLAHDASRRLRAQMEVGGIGSLEVGLDGIGGIAYASYHTWLRTGSDDALACLKRSCGWLVARLASRERAVNVDLVGGEAGALLTVLTLIEADIFEGDLLVRTALGLVGLLLAASVDVPGGRAWPIFDTGDHIVGLGHGSAGIAWALHRAASVLDHRTAEIAEAVEGAIAYEDATFLRPIGNWADPRAADEPAQMNAWCYGAAGVRLARRLMVRPPPDGCVTMHDGDVLPVDHLCCGVAGRVLMAARHDDDTVGQVADSMAQRVLAGEVRLGTDDLEDQSAYGDQASQATSLFRGAPGIAWSLAHVAQPGVHPEVLVLG